MNDPQKTVLARITGRVQGVSFRAWTRAEAMKLDLSGWVRNETDGSVAALLSGQRNAVDKMVLLLWQGPPHSSVSEVKITQQETNDTIGSFRILR
jgi:acylphosphatase